MTHEELRRLFHSSKIANSVRKIQRGKKPKRLKQPDKKDPEDTAFPCDESDDAFTGQEQTRSIKQMMDEARRLILQRKESDPDRIDLFRVDFYYLSEGSQWYSADWSTPEGRKIVRYLSTTIGCPKPFLEGKTVQSHFWLQFDFGGDEGEHSVPGVYVFDEKQNLGIPPWMFDDEEAQEQDTSYEEELDLLFGAIPEGCDSLADDESPEFGNDEGVEVYAGEAVSV